MALRRGARQFATMVREAATAESRRTQLPALAVRMQVQRSPGLVRTSGLLAQHGEFRISPENSNVLVRREVNDGAVIFSLYVNRAAVRTLGHITFVDACHVGQQLTAGRPLGMVEAESGRREFLTSPVAGEVVAVNSELLASPGSLNDICHDPKSWLVKLDSFLAPGDQSREWDALQPFE